MDQIRDRAHTSWTDITIDFRNRASWYDQEQDPTEPWEARDHFWDRTRGDYYAADTESD